jgi:serine-type D-Ala-D-Ala carboxypeptidase/endopeptidase
VAILGQTVAHSLGSNYEGAIKAHILDKIGMNETVFKLSKEQLERTVQGYNYEGNLAEIWDFDVMSPTGAIKSTSRDMAKFLKYQLSGTGELAEAANFTRETYSDVQVVFPEEGEPGTKQKMGLGWHIETIEGREIFWHNGGTDGFLSFMAIDLENRSAVFIVGNQLKVIDEKLDNRIDQSGFEILLGL